MKTRQEIENNLYNLRFEMRVLLGIWCPQQIDFELCLPYPTPSHLQFTPGFFAQGKATTNLKDLTCLIF